jgi:16S rRNA (adenine1518-N6/adenine1519-N6)-dimethyltransferase
LTKLLVARSGYVVAIEIDVRFVEELRASVRSANLKVVHADVLDVDWDDFTEAAKAMIHPSPRDQDKRRVRVVANLPYYISTTIIEKLVRLGRRQVWDMTLMLQREVADRIVTGPGSKEYGSLSVMAQYYCEAATLFEVPPSAFTPAPKVRSAVINLIVRERPPVEVADETRFFAFVRAAFAQRRKTILNNMKAAAVSLDFRQPLEAALEAASVAGQRRAETLSLVEFAALCEALYRR